MELEKHCKCEHPYNKCNNECLCKATYIQYKGVTNLYYICPDCQKQHEKDLESIKQNYEAQFGKDWH